MNLIGLILIYLPAGRGFYSRLDVNVEDKQTSNLKNGIIINRSKNTVFHSMRNKIIEFNKYI